MGILNPDIKHGCKFLLSLLFFVQHNRNTESGKKSNITLTIDVFRENLVMPNIYFSTRVQQNDVSILFPNESC